MSRAGGSGSSSRAATSISNCCEAGSGAEPPIRWTALESLDPGALQGVAQHALGMHSDPMGDDRSIAPDDHQRRDPSNSVLPAHRALGVEQRGGGVRELLE